MKKLNWMAICLVSMAAGAVMAKTVIWGGATSGTWKVGGSGWIDPAGNETTFEEGDNVILSNATANVTLTASGKFSVGHFLFNSDYTWVLQGSDTVTNMASYTKMGSGLLNHKGFRGTFTNDLLFVKGTTENETTGLSADRTSTPWGNLRVPRTFYVGTGDTNCVPRLWMGYSNGIGHSTLPPWEFLPVEFVLDAGTLELGYQTCSGALGDVTFLHGGLMVHQYEGNYQVINGRIKALRSETGSRIPGGISSARKIQFGVATKQPVEIYVEEVSSEDGTDDGKADFVIDAKIYDYTTNNLDGDTNHNHRSSWRKTGPGTLYFSGHNNPLSLPGRSFGYGSRDSVYTGDVFIDEGTVVVSLGFAWGMAKDGCSLGLLRGLDRERTVYVNEGGKLVLGPGNNYGIISYIDYPPVELAIAVSNTVLQLKHKTQVGSIKLYGTGNFEYNAQFGLGALVYLEREEPYTFNSVGSTQNYLAHLTDTVTVNPPEGSTERVTLYGFTEFCVQKATNNPEALPDATIDCVFRDAVGDNAQYPNKRNLHCGIKKTGPGLLLMTNRTHNYTYETVAAGGGLILNGTVQKTTRAKDGGVIGGSGRIKEDLVIETDGGLLVDAANTTAALRVDGKASFPTEGLIRLYNVDAANEMEISYEGLPLPVATGGYEGFDAVDTSAWKVEVDGWEPSESKHLAVTFDPDNGTYDVKYQRRGTRIIIR